MTGQLNINTDRPVIHVLFAGIRFELSQAVLEISSETDEYGIKRALSRRLKVPMSRFDDHVVDRDDDGNMTIRPEEAV